MLFFLIRPDIIDRKNQQSVEYLLGNLSDKIAKEAEEIMHLFEQNKLLQE